MPPKLTAHTGMDALTHAIEAYVSTLNSPFTDPLALKAIHMVFDYLPASYNGDMAAREQMHYGQCLAGMAFSNALLGIVHSMAHKTGAAFSTGHIPHGCANAIYLPYVIQYNAKDPTALKRYADIARSVGIEGSSDEELMQKLCAKIDDYNVQLNIPKTLKEFGINEAEFKEKVAKIAELAVGDACTGSNPARNHAGGDGKAPDLHLLWNKGRFLIDHPLADHPEGGTALLGQGISKQTLRRLPMYLSYLKSLPGDAPQNISATSIADAMNLNQVQVRKDLAAVSSSGRPRSVMSGRT